jgi:hypothetical protein
MMYAYKAARLIEDDVLPKGRAFSSLLQHAKYDETFADQLRTDPFLRYVFTCMLNNKDKDLAKKKGAAAAMKTVLDAIVNRGELVVKQKELLRRANKSKTVSNAAALVVDRELAVTMYLMESFQDSAPVKHLLWHVYNSLVWGL